MKKQKQLICMTRAALAAAALCLVGPLTIGIGPIPLSLCTLVLYALPFAMEWYHALASVAVYLLLGAVGLPIFSGFEGGVGKLVGPTGGYLMGYLLLVGFCGLAIRRFPERRAPILLGMLAGTAALYALGTAWFMLQTGSQLLPTLSLCVLPFLPGDAVKLALALKFGPRLRKTA